MVVRALRPLFRQALVAVYGGRGMPWSINGIPLRIDPALREEMGQVYDKSVVDWLRPRVAPGQVAWNVGANVGVYTLQLAHWVGAQGHVVAVEPNPAARGALERHLRWNGLADRVTVIAAAVGAVPGEATLWADGASAMSALDRPNPALAGRAHPVTVPVTTLDTLLRRGDLPRPDWIVMDIEGYEIAALRGARELLAHGAAAPGVVLELHPGVWEALGHSSADFDELVGDFGRKVHPLRGDGDPREIHSIVALMA